MSPRPRTVTDEEILAATGRALQRVNPAQFTLTDVSAEVGLSPATLLQRFGSKRGLLVAYAAQASGAVAAEFAAARAAGGPVLATLVGALCGMTRWVATAEALSNSLAFLQLDLSDPEFHRHALAQARAMRAEIGALLEAAVAAGELRPSDTESLARAVQVTYNGALMTWAIEREGTVSAWLSDALLLLLEPYRAARRAPGSPD